MVVIYSFIYSLVFLNFAVLCCFFYFFFFKQKTAYELRISDWSSDVCSSDLLARMQEILEQDLRAGAFGLSTGLEYVPGRYAEPRELSSLGPVIARHGGVAMSHMRNEDADQVRASIRELVANSGPARAPVSHLKMAYGKERKNPSPNSSH